MVGWPLDGRLGLDLKLGRILKTGGLDSFNKLCWPPIIIGLNKLSGWLLDDRSSTIARTMCCLLRGGLDVFWLLNQVLAHIVGTLGVLLSGLLVSND